MKKSLRDVDAELRAPKVNTGSLGYQPLWYSRPLRVSGTVHAVDKQWVEVTLKMQITEDGDWLSITPKHRPMMVARRYSGEVEAKELYVISSLRSLLDSPHLSVEYGPGERREMGDTVEWRYWATVTSRFTWSVRHQPDGTVGLLGLN